MSLTIGSIVAPLRDYFIGSEKISHKKEPLWSLWVLQLPTDPDPLNALSSEPRWLSDSDVHLEPYASKPTALNPNPQTLNPMLLKLQRLHIDYHYGIGPQTTILIMVLGTLIP